MENKKREIMYICAGERYIKVYIKRNPQLSFFHSYNVVKNHFLSLAVRAGVNTAYIDNL